ncbi:MAG: outer membrane protein transport protein [Pirellulales bacterium]|nr:outer membrane protein transport protein [Pirellulales bacterium]
MKKPITVGFGVLGLVAWMVGAALADGVMRDGLGAISSGRGGANIAFADNASVLLDNPAGMSAMESCGLIGLGVDLLMTDLNYQDPENSVDAKFHPMPLPEVALMRRSCDGRWGYGLGVFAPAGFSAEYDMSHPLLGDRLYKSIGGLVKVLPGLSYRLTDRLAIGATFGVAVSHAEIEGPYFVQTGPFRGAPCVLDLQGTGAAPVYSLGLQYQLTERTTMGLAYQSASRFELHGSASTDIYGLAPLPVSSRFDAEVDLEWPRSLGLGLKHELSGDRRLGVDVIWFDWSDAFDSIDMRFADATNPLVPAVLGQTVTDSLPLDWEDSISVRIGYEQAISPCAVVRAGYVYHGNPIPTATLTPYIPAVVEHGVSAGFSRILGQWSVDLAYQYSFGDHQEVALSSLAGGDFNYSRVEAHAHWLLLGFTRRY